MDCHDCNLCSFSDPTCIWGTGNPKAKVMVINSYASEQDEEEGAAVMPSSLVERLKGMGLDPSKVYYTTISVPVPGEPSSRLGTLRSVRSIWIRR